MEVPLSSESWAPNPALTSLTAWKQMPPRFPFTASATDLQSLCRISDSKILKLLFSAWFLTDSKISLKIFLFWSSYSLIKKIKERWLLSHLINETQKDRKTLWLALEQRGTPSGAHRSLVLAVNKILFHPLETEEWSSGLRVKAQVLSLHSITQIKIQSVHHLHTALGTEIQ